MSYYDDLNNRQRPRPRPRPPFFEQPDYPQEPPYYSQPPFYGQPGTPGRPPYEQPSGFPPSGFQGGPPTGAPPSFQPQQSPSLFMIDPGAIRSCINQYVYIWLEDGRSFWAWLTFVGRRSIAGWQWVRNRWVYFGTDINNISSFVCY